jgi:hypothetical protein
MRRDLGLIGAHELPRPPTYTRGPVEVVDGIVAVRDASGVATAVFRVKHRGP